MKTSRKMKEENKTKEKIEFDKNLLDRIKELAYNLLQEIKSKKSPSLKTPLRNLANVHYNKEKGYFEIGSKIKKRTLTVNTSKTFAQTLRMLSLSKTLIETDDIATKREAYYVSKNWGDARFLEQPESDAIMDDIEAMFLVNREKLGFIPEEKGGDVAGKLMVIDKDPETGKEIKIDCTKMGTGAYSIPSSVEHLKLISYLQ